MSNRNYQYSVELGAAPAYDVLYDFDENYLTDQQGKVILRFAIFGGSPRVSWGRGQQATRVSERNPLPYGIKVRWFSVAENQFWEGTYQFNQHFLQQLTQYTVDNKLSRSKKVFTDRFRIKVYVVPEGLVTVWIISSGTQFLLAQFQANKVEEPNWDYFSQRALQLNRKFTREEYIKEILSRPEMRQTAQELSDGKKPSSAFWKQLMKTYNWQLTLSDGFILKDYLAWYLNGEQFFTYTLDNQLAKKRPVPYDLNIYFEGNGHSLQRFNLVFDKEEIKQAFTQMSLTPPLEQPINFHLQISKDLKKAGAFLIKGDNKIELHKVKGARVKLYNNS